MVSSFLHVLCLCCGKIVLGWQASFRHLHSGDLALSPLLFVYSL